MKNEDNKINFQIMETSSTLQTEELKDRTIESFKSRHEDLERFYINQHVSEYIDDDIEQEFYEYFLSVDVGYDEFVRLQISYGGPQEEFRIFKDGHIEYCLLDWYQGYSLNVTDNKIAQWLKESFIDIGISYNNNIFYDYKKLFEEIELVKKITDINNWEIEQDYYEFNMKDEL